MNDNLALRPFHRNLLVIPACLGLGLTLAACGVLPGAKDKESSQEVGSLSRTYTVIDEQGRKAGTLTLLPLGGAELRDANGRLLGTLAPTGRAQEQWLQPPSYGQPAGTAR